MSLTIRNFIKSFTPEKADKIIHPKYGDLSDPGSVTLDVDPHAMLNCDKDYLLVHVSITGRCNAHCSGCINVELTSKNRYSLLSNFEVDPERDSLGVFNLIKEKNFKDVVVALYGGEPLLDPQKCIDLIHYLNGLNEDKNIKYMVYTNGMLIDKIIDDYPEFFNNIWLVSISIDGTNNQHNAFRRGTDLKKIIDNLKYLRSGYNCKVIMWSTLREEQSLLDCYVQFKRLYDAKLVDYFFYHLAEADEGYRDFQSYVLKYENEFEKVLNDIKEHLSKGQILPIIHLNELITYILTGYRRGHSGCGVELMENFDIVGGKILPCADLPMDYKIGQIDETGNPILEKLDLSHLIKYRDSLGCNICGIEPYCGGRCPVQVLLGSDLRTLQICQVLRLHVAMVKDMVGEIGSYLKKFDLTPDKFYLTSGYLSKLTDVIP